MARIEKDKNLFKVYVDGKENPYVLNIQTGVLVGLKGTPLKRTPAGMPTALSSNCNSSNLSRLIYIIHERYGVGYADFDKNNGKWLSYLAFWDKVDSICNGAICSSTWEMTNKQYIEFADNHFKEYAKYVKDKGKVGLEVFYRDFAFDIWCKTNGVQVDEYISRDTLKTIMDANFNSPKKVKYSVYMAKRGLFEFIYSSDAIRKLRDYFNYCEWLGIDYEKGDFIKNYLSVKKRYEFRKIEIDNEQLAKNQLKYEKALTFSYGNLETIIPTTCQQFHEEAEMQSNCVERMYLERVVEGTTNIVFIRKKDDMEHSYITCEVKKGDIWQYLTRFNNTPREEEAQAFYEAFEAHLKEYWKE